MPGARYAIYFVPERDSALYCFGASVLGYDCYSGEPIPVIDGAPSDWATLTAEPRRYGFHATLKAPFHLRDGATEAALCGEVDDFARRQCVVDAGPLVIREIGSFIALVPQTACVPLNHLAADCVRDFDHFRAPLSATDRERRAPARLTTRQVEHLDGWGYPYVFDDFRFHMTLTGSLGDDDRARALSFNRHKFEPLPQAKTLTISQIVVAKQTDRTAQFKILHVAPLSV